MPILYLDLTLNGSNDVEFRYFWDNPNEVTTCSRSLNELEDRRIEVYTHYYTRLPEEYATTGQALYDWLDGNQRILQREIDQHRHSGIILAISTSQGLDQFPWEVLHDGESFLVANIPAIVPLRWVRTGSERQLTLQNEPADRALNVLFMASSARGVNPELDFEAEEARILEATSRNPLSLIVEESGCLDELFELVRTRERGYFDVIHLTGHAGFRDPNPYFITETEFGERRDSNATDIAGSLQFNPPKLIFLSGCQTGYSERNGVFSMAEGLLNLGANAVMAWGQPVSDRDASTAAAILYQGLAAGDTLVEALAHTYQNLLEVQARDWHLLRLFVTRTLPEALVTRVNRRIRMRPLSSPSTSPRFIDRNRHLRVATRETFVGRRRELQNCLRVLQTSPNNEIGVLIQGMGGIGKSTLAARLCDRLSDYRTLVWWRQVDETSLVNSLADNLESEEQRTRLRNGEENLRYRLRYIFGELNTTPFLLIFDDFEWNLDYREGNGSYILNPNVANILADIAWAIQETNYYHRIIITCRYVFDSDLLHSFYLLRGLQSLQRADLQKMLRRLNNFNSESIDASYIERALNLADGNPRLLEWLNNDVLSPSANDINTQLSQYESNPRGWMERIIWELDNQPQLQIDEAVEEVISHCLIYEIPVPRSALEAVCESISCYQQQLEIAIERGLIEISLEREEQVYHVSRILPRIFPNLQLPEAPDVYSLYENAHDQLHELWGNEENRSEEKWREIFRLLFANENNPDRFRTGFSEMLNVQYNPEADLALLAELRRNNLEPPSTGNFYCQLENYLRENNWREADEETAWLFYLVMVWEDYRDWDELCQRFSLEILQNIDQLWVNFSNQMFGFRIQSSIWESLETQDLNLNIRNEEFGRRVNWNEENEWRDYDSMLSSISSPSVCGQLPALVFTHALARKPFFGGAVVGWTSGQSYMVFGYLGRNSIFSRINSG